MKIMILIACLGISLPAMAQVEQIDAHIETVSCALCFSTAILELKQLPGVTDVAGDLKAGSVTLSIDPKHGISIKDVIEKLKTAGYKDGNDLQMVASGALEQRGEKMILTVPFQSELIVVEPAERKVMAAQMAANKEKAHIRGWLTIGNKQYGLKIDKLQKQ